MIKYNNEIQSNLYLKGIQCNLKMWFYEQMPIIQVKIISLRVRAWVGYCSAKDDNISIWCSKCYCGDVIFWYLIWWSTCYCGDVIFWYFIWCSTCYCGDIIFWYFIFLYRLKLFALFIHWEMRLAFIYSDVLYKGAL